MNAPISKIRTLRVNGQTVIINRCMFFFFSSVTSSAELLFSSNRRKELAVILLSRTPWPKPRLSSWLSLRSIITSSWPVESTPMSFISMSHILHQNIHGCLQWTCINHVCQSQWDHWAVFEDQTNKSIYKTTWQNHTWQIELWTKALYIQLWSVFTTNTPTLVHLPEFYLFNRPNLFKQRSKDNGPDCHDVSMVGCQIICL